MTKHTPGFARALGRVVQDPEVIAVWERMSGQQETMLNRFGQETDDDGLLGARLKAFILAEAKKADAAAQDLARQHFTLPERELLRDHPDGGPLLRRLAEGDVEAVPPSTALLRLIQTKRRELGVDL